MNNKNYYKLLSSKNDIFHTILTIHNHYTPPRRFSQVKCNHFRQKYVDFCKKSLKKVVLSRFN